MKRKLIISFSGGRTSAYMTWWLLNNMQHKYEMRVVFANTGKEREETLEFVRKCDEYFGFNVVWVEAFVHYVENKGTTHVVTNFEDAERDGQPFEDVIFKYGIPNKPYPHCSRELKAQPIRSYARSIGWTKYYTAIGIRHDETSRIDFKKSKKERLIYPLATINRVFTSDINLFWSKQPFDLELKSYQGNCDLCWKKSNRKLMTIVKENPEKAEWWRNMEKQYGSFVPESRKNSPVNTPITFFRNSKSIDDIIENSKHPFEPALDTSKDIDFYKQVEMFDLNLDEHGSCSESCEAF